MANIANFDGIASGDAPLASVVSNNFTKIAAAINSNALNSDNYGISSIKSQHISTAQILSQHLANEAVVADNLSAGAVVHAKVNFASSDDGVRALQIGSVSSDMPVHGVIAGRYTQTVAIASTAVTLAQTIAWTDAIDGNPGFTGNPQFGNPMFQVSATDLSAPVAYNVTSLNSVNAIFAYAFSASAGTAHTATVNLVAVGPK